MGTTVAGIALDGAELWVDSYEDTPCMAVMLHGPGMGQHDWEILTRHISDTTGNGSLMMPFCAYVDTGNHPGLDRELCEAGLAEPYKRFGEPVTCTNGFNEYPLMQFDADRLRALDPEGCARYEADWEGWVRRWQSSATPERLFEAVEAVGTAARAQTRGGRTKDTEKHVARKRGW